MNVTYREISDSDRAGIEEVAKLHMGLLGFGPMAQLGHEFIRDVGYKVHLQDDLIQIILCEVGGRAAGFVAFTSRSITFHRASMRSHWILASWFVLKAIIKDPRRIVGLKRAVWMVASRRKEHRGVRDPLGEVVCLAVKPEYLTREFIRKHGVWISEKLVRGAMSRLAAEGCSEMRMLVDEDNKAPLLVYHRMGARFESYSHGGEPNIQVWFDLVGESDSSNCAC